MKPPRMRRPSREPAPTDGAWLSEEGPYLDLIKKLCVSDPSLRKPDRKNRYFKNPLQPGKARVARLWIKTSGVQREDYEGTEGSARLRAHFRNSSHARDNELYVMEGLAKDYISVLGTQLSVPPSFFVFQERNHIWAFDHQSSPDTTALPSLLGREAGFKIKYYEVCYSGDWLASFNERCATTGRHVGATSPEGQATNIFTVRRKCAYWQVQRNDGTWSGES